MKKSARNLIGVIIAAGMAFAVVAEALAGTFDLQLKRLEPVARVQASSGLSADYLFRLARPQQFTMQGGAGQSVMRIMDGRGESVAESFARVVRKERSEYRSEHPFRGVAKLGSGEYGFVIDILPPEPKEKESEKEKKAEAESADAEPKAQREPAAPDDKGYCVLYFDLNHNGDLTDDEVIEGTVPEGRRFSPGYWLYQFPRVDLTIDVEGAKVDYAFFFAAYWRVLNAGPASLGTGASAGRAPASRGVTYVSAALQAAAYREGEVELGDTTHSVAVVDFNSNGRFDDAVQIRESTAGQVSPIYGDMLLVDHDPEKQSFPLNPYDLLQSQVANAVSMDGQLYEMEITPGGDKLTLAPYSKALGYVTPPSDGFRATVYSDKGLLKVSGDKSDRVPLPAGDWKLLEYTIDLTGRSADDSEEPEGRSLLEGLAGALLGQSGSRSRMTVVSARGGREVQLVQVRKGQTVPMPCGPPFKPVVTASGFVAAGQTAQLALSLVGSGGETCSSLIVDGGRPEQPGFTISTSGGEEVDVGKFKWG
jgi:hypothetical protein